MVESVRKRFELLRPVMNERVRRQWAASEALCLARGGVAAVAQATGLSRTTIWAGVRELRARACPRSRFARIASGSPAGAAAR